MKYRKIIMRSVVIIVIASLSVLAGFVAENIADRKDRGNYQRDFAEYVSKYSEEYSVPEYVVYAVIKYESGFDTGHVGENGEIGLMGITFDQFDSLLKITKENLTHDALYGPETNIKYGTYLLSRFFDKYNQWYSVYCAKLCGEEKLDEMLKREGAADESGKLINIDDSSLKEKTDALSEMGVKYKELYY